MVLVERILYKWKDEGRLMDSGNINNERLGN